VGLFASRSISGNGNASENVNELRGILVIKMYPVFAVGSSFFSPRKGSLISVQSGSVGIKVDGNFEHYFKTRTRLRHDDYLFPTLFNIATG
jgi:hypothetical protein